MRVPLEIVHQDEQVVAINKPSGVVVHRSELVNDRVTCLSLLRDQIGRRVFPVHRLDRGASGVLLFALDPVSARPLAEALATRHAQKRYRVAVRGWPPDEGLLERPLDCEGRVLDAVTRFRRLTTSELPVATGPRHPTSRFALLDVEPFTGRLHQIRRHLQGGNWPVLGDNGHGDARQNRRLRELFGLKRLMLHAAALELAHPDGRRLRLEAPVPEDMAAPLRALGLA